MTTTIAIIHPAKDEISIASYPEPVVTLAMLVESIFGDGERGSLERVNAGRINLWVDGDGKDNRPWTPNNVAQFVLESFAERAFPDDYLAGVVVVTGRVTDEGDTMGLTDDQIARVLHLSNID